MNKEVWGNKYKNYKIMADSRVHEKVVEILKRKRLNGNIQLLDIACGEGALSQRIRDTFPDWEIDINDIDFHNIKFKEYNNKYGYNLNEVFLFEKKYDVIIAVEIIEHLENPWSFLSGIRSVLKKDGLVIVSTPNMNSVKDRLYFLFEGYHIYFGNRGIENSGHINMIPKCEFENICSNVDLKIENVDAVGELPSGWRSILLKILFMPVILLMKDKNTASIYIFSISNR